MILTGSIKGQLNKWQRHRTAVLGLQSVLKSCLKDAMNVLTKYFPSASIFCHQINHPLSLHDLYKGRKVTVTQVTDRTRKRTNALQGTAQWGAHRHYCDQGKLGFCRSWNSGDIYCLRGIVLLVPGSLIHKSKLLRTEKQFNFTITCMQLERSFPTPKPGQES